MNSFENQTETLANAILSDYRQGRDIDKTDPDRHPDQAAVTRIIAQLLGIIYPVHLRGTCHRELSECLVDVMCKLKGQIHRCLRSRMGEEEAGTRSQEICLQFFRQIPAVRARVQQDLEAAYAGDPAATGTDEIIFCSPGLLAITVYRLAHELHLLEVPMLPRIMTEQAHAYTGIDIHPGAVIGNGFFIDHGTGIVIGETTQIGDHVKIYQGVTLGGLSTRAGQGLRGQKRHPTIQDNVTIYANATILGGDTVIGRDSIIGANTFITHSVPPGTTVTIKNQELQYRNQL